MKFTSVYIFYFRGQIQGSNTLFNTADVELINEGYRYKVQATKSGPNTYFIVMNGSFKEIEVHRLSDGGTVLNLICIIHLVCKCNSFNHKIKLFILLQEKKKCFQSNSGQKL